MPVEVVFLDVGGPIYGDRPYYEAVLAAIREVRPDTPEAEFWAAYEACRRDQAGSFTRRLARRFLDEGQLERVVARARELWDYPPEALQPGAREAVAALAGRYRLGVLANQQRWIRRRLARDGLDVFFDLWFVSEEVGMEKPDAALFRAAVEAAGVPAGRCAMVGDRLDYDVLPARRAGMRGVWLLQGEAPDEPTREQAALADLVVRELADLPDALTRL